MRARHCVERCCACFSRDAAGGVAVEFAVIAPLMLLVYLAMAEMTASALMHSRVSAAVEAAAEYAASAADNVDLDDVEDAALEAFGGDPDQKLEIEVGCKGAGLIAIDARYRLDFAGLSVLGDALTITASATRGVGARSLCREE